MKLVVKCYAELLQYVVYDRAGRGRLIDEALGRYADHGTGANGSRLRDSRHRSLFRSWKTPKSLVVFRLY
jgi:hypothetical protein